MSDIDISVGTEYDEGLKRVETDVQTIDELFAEGAGAAGQFSSALLSAYSQDDSNLVAKVIAQEQFNTQLSAAQGVVAAMTEEEKIAYMAGLELADATEQAGQKADGAKGQFQVFGLSLTDLKSGIDLAKGALDKLEAVWEFGKEGAENERIADSFAETADSVNVSADEMSSALDRAAKGTVDDEVYMQTATRNMALGVATTIQDNVAIMEMARASTRKFGGDTESAFEGISTAIGNLQTRQLKQYGIIIDAKQVNEDYAKTLGKTADQLTEAEQREALRNEVLRQSKDLVGTVGDAALNSAEKFKKFETQAGNVIDSLKELAVDIITPVLDRGEAMQVMMDTGASTADRLTAAYQVQGDYLAGPMQDVATQMIDKLQQQVAEEWELFRAQNMRKVSLDELTGSVLTSIGAAAQAAGAHQAAMQAQAGLGALYRATVDDSAAYNAVAAETAANIKAVADADAAATAAAGIHAAAQATLAEKLSGTATAAINAELARAAIGSLGALQTSDPEAYAEAVGKIQIAYGLATEKSQTMAEGVDIITSAFNNGQISRDDFIKAIGMIPKAADDGKISLQEFGLKTQTADANAKAAALQLAAFETRLGATGSSALDATGDIAGYNAELLRIPTSITTVITQRYVTEGTPATGSSLPTRAGGGDVMAGWPYWVGEEGPEPYVPAQNGRILSRTDAMNALSRSGGGDTGQIAGALNAMASAIQGLQRGGDLYLTTGPVLDDRTVDELAERVLRAWQSRQ